jgi:hypothetical protein
MCVGRREKDWITFHAIPKPSSVPGLAIAAQNDPQAHLHLLDRFLEVAPSLVDLEDALTRPTLWHGDLHSSNVFVEGSHITAIIDWQGAWAGPLFLQAQPSPILDYRGEIILKRPDNFDDLSSDEQAEIKRTISKSTLFQLYLLETEQRNPLLARAFHLDHGKTRRLPVALSGNTWDDDIVSFRGSLIDVERYVRKALHAICDLTHRRPLYSGIGTSSACMENVRTISPRMSFLDIQPMPRIGTPLRTFSIASKA